MGRVTLGQNWGLAEGKTLIKPQLVEGCDVWFGFSGVLEGFFSPSLVFSPIFTLGEAGCGSPGHRIPNEKSLLFHGHLGSHFVPFLSDSPNCAVGAGLKGSLMSTACVHFSGNSSLSSKTSEPPATHEVDESGVNFLTWWRLPSPSLTKMSSNPLFSVRPLASVRGSVVSQCGSRSSQNLNQERTAAHSTFYQTGKAGDGCRYMSPISQEMSRETHGFNGEWKDGIRVLSLLS